MLLKRTRRRNSMVQKRPDGLKVSRQTHTWLVVRAWDGPRRRDLEIAACCAGSSHAPRPPQPQAGNAPPPRLPSRRPTRQRRHGAVLREGGRVAAVIIQTTHPDCRPPAQTFGAARAAPNRPTGRQLNCAEGKAGAFTATHTRRVAKGGATLFCILEMRGKRDNRPRSFFPRAGRRTGAR